MQRTFKVFVTVLAICGLAALTFAASGTAVGTISKVMKGDGTKAGSFILKGEGPNGSTFELVVDFGEMTTCGSSRPEDKGKMHCDLVIVPSANVSVEYETGEGNPVAKSVTAR